MSIFLFRAVVTKATLERSWANTKAGIRSLLVGVKLLLLLAGSATAHPQTWDRAINMNMVRISSIAEDKVYGLLIGAPESGCRLVRYRVETVGRVLLGKTPVLAAGDVAIVRIGNGFRPGTHTLLVTAEGCSKSFQLFRQVTLRKASPDHGWRAARAKSTLVTAR